VLNALTAFWMARFAPIIPNHFDTSVDLAKWLTPAEMAQAQGRAVVAKKLKALPVEAVARGYLIGSGWKDYQATGAVCGIPIPAGMQLAGKLAEPIFTPAFKAPKGEHDANISFEETVRLVGEKLANQVRDVTLRLYREASEFAATRGILIADTKFEFGIDDAGTLHLIDEVLTPDSSRFWPADQYRPGVSPPSFDKQYVRDYLETLDWNKTAPGPRLPAEVIERTARTYREAQRLLTGT
jgi:phosphoribosylaminoimidazole-succinocarboxamide synthase